MIKQMYSIPISMIDDYFNKDVPALAPQPSIVDPALFPQEHLCTEDEVYDLIAELDDSKSSGPDGISVKMLKATITSITPSLPLYLIKKVLFLQTGSLHELSQFLNQLNCHHQQATGRFQVYVL